MQRDLVELGAVLATACAAGADQAARYIRTRAEDLGSIDWELKSRADFVSDVDRAAEERISAVLLTRCPEATVLGEELSPGAATKSGVVFVVDPLDGTTNFLHGYPQYAVSVAAAVDGILVAGVVVDIPRNVCYRASLASGATRDGVRLTVSGIQDPGRSLVGTGFPFKHRDQVDGYLTQLGRVLRASAGVRRAGAAALDLADVAAGRLDAFWELMLAPWDIAAGLVLVREAGGRVTDLESNEVGIEHTGVIATNGHLHAWLEGTVQGAGLSPDVSVPPQGAHH